MSNKKFRGIGVLAAALAATVTAAGLAQPSWAATPSAPSAAGSTLMADPTDLATPEDKVKAAAEIGVLPDAALLILNDQAFVLELWRRAKDDTFVKVEAWRAYDTENEDAAYAFITAGIFAASAQDAQIEYAEAQARGVRRSVAVIVRLDPEDTALIELGDRDFIFAVWQRVEEGSHVWTAARDAIAAGTGQADWTEFLTTGAAAAAAQDVADAIADADAELAAELARQQLVAGKKSLLQLLVLPVTEELVNAPNRQFVLHIHSAAKGVEVKLAAQAALNAPDAELDQALKTFILTGGAIANRKDEDAAAARELAGYKAQVTAIRDAAKVDGLQTNLVNAANRALTTGTTLALQTFLLKGEATARALDRKAHADVVVAGDRIGVLAADGKLYARDGATLANSGWTTQYSNVKTFAISSGRVGIVTDDGTAYAKEGGLSTAWVKLYSNVKQIVLAGTRVGVVTNDGIAYVKDGSLSAAWVKEYTGVTQLTLAGTRIGVLTTSGTPLVKEGGLSANWDEQNASAKAKFMALDGTRVGIITQANTVYVKEGAINTNSWVQQYEIAGDLRLSGTRIGVIQRPNVSVPENPVPVDAAGRPYVKDGTLASTAWTNVRPTSDAIRLSLSGDRIAVVAENGTVYVKDGTISAAWVAVRTI